MATEQRHFFRIEDDVYLQTLPVSEAQAIEQHIPKEFSDGPGHGLMRNLMHIDHENGKLMRAIGDVSRELEQYLHNLNRKIELVAQHLSGLDNETAPDSMRHVTLSEGGIAFPAAQAVVNGSHLAVQITLLPSQITLVLFAKVIQCTPQASQFQIATSFCGLTEGDRQILARHIMQVQQRQRRREP